MSNITGSIRNSERPLRKQRQALTRNSERDSQTSSEESEESTRPARKLEFNTKEKLLTAAEWLFSQKGFDAVSHREIASAAAANLASVNYHFGSKQDLIRAVIRRRIDAINACRLQALAEAQQEARCAPVPSDKIMKAFFGPSLEDANWELQSLLCNGPTASPYRDYFISLMAPVVTRFAGELRRSLPETSYEDCHCCMYFSLAVLGFALKCPQYFTGVRRSSSRPIVSTQRILQVVCSAVNGHA